MVAPCPRAASISRTALRRSHPRQEPSAVVPHAGVCAGGGEQSSSLPQLLVLGLCVLGLVASIAGMVFGRASGNAGVGIVSTLALPVFIVGVILTVNAYSLLNAFAHLSFH